MLDLDDPRWERLEGGYRVPYDPRPALERLELDADHSAVWEELWDNLYHQGDVGEASYAVIPHLARIIRDRGLIDWNIFALASSIELERESGHNPPIPSWLAPSYEAAWEQLFELARTELAGATETVTLRCLLATIAIAKGDHRRGRMLLEYDDDELDELVGEYEFDGETSG